MRRTLILGTSALCFLFSQAHPQGMQLGLSQPHLLAEAGSEILIHNWILARPADKPITVLDLTKRLETIFRQEYPEYTESNQARFQFYSMSWRHLLNEMIDTELMMADAAEKHVEASDGDIRQELELVFGPNVPDTLNELGLTYEDAWEMVRANLVTGEMRHYMVVSRALLGINPQKIQEAYEEYRAAFTGKDEWQYQVLSMRHRDREEAEQAVKWAQELLKEHPDFSLEQLHEQLLLLRSESLIDGRTAISLSEVETRELSSLASSYRAALQDTEIGSLSAPVSQTSRSNGSTVLRIFALVDHQVEELPTFASLEAPLQNHLMQVLASEESKRYREQLRRHYGIDEDYLDQMIPPEFEPYELI